MVGIGIGILSWDSMVLYHIVPFDISACVVVYGIVPDDTMYPIPGTWYMISCRMMEP